MQPLRTDEIAKRLENIRPGEKLRMRTNETFGEYMAIFELNPAWPNKGEKKYLLWVGKTEEAARAGKPFLKGNKAKKLAAWAAARWADWLPEDIAPQRAA